MRVVVHDEDGREMYSYDTKKDSNCLLPARDERSRARSALIEATIFLGTSRRSGNDNKERRS